MGGSIEKTAPSSLQSYRNLLSACNESRSHLALNSLQISTLKIKEYQYYLFIYLQFLIQIFQFSSIYLNQLLKFFPISLPQI